MLQTSRCNARGEGKGGDGMRILVFILSIANGFFTSWFWDNFYMYNVGWAPLLSTMLIGIFAGVIIGRDLE